MFLYVHFIAKIAINVKIIKFYLDFFLRINCLHETQLRQFWLMETICHFSHLIEHKDKI